ncbi:hypothetical protein YWIDRAFT_07988 [Streptomyces sp. SceaMP-e96]|nr:hypothetical protein YWIDRAFT_07988 [Streptomyces sp. SceaMP-e96]
MRARCSRWQRLDRDPSCARRSRRIPCRPSPSPCCPPRSDRLRRAYRATRGVRRTPRYRPRLRPPDRMEECADHGDVQGKRPPTGPRPAKPLVLLVSIPRWRGGGSSTRPMAVEGRRRDLPATHRTRARLATAIGRHRRASTAEARPTAGVACSLSAGARPIPGLHDALCCPCGEPPLLPFSRAFARVLPPLGPVPVRVLALLGCTTCERFRLAVVCSHSPVDVRRYVRACVRPRRSFPLQFGVQVPRTPHTSK